MHNLCTPRINAWSDDRLQLALSDEDFAKIRRRDRWQATVTDQATGTRYVLRGAACSLPHCHCDAVVVALKA
jgi:hypothetical protein